MSKHKNLVFIFSDQQRYDTMACYGNDWIKTPHLNALSEDSFIMERAYVGQPVCTPARGTITTGLHPHNAGPTVNVIPLPPEQKTIAEYLPSEYETAWFGKWHLGDDGNAQHGFKHWISTEDHMSRFVGLSTEPSKSDWHNYLVDQGYSPDSTLSNDQPHLPKEVTKNAIDNWEVFSPEKRSELPAEHQMAHFLGRNAVEFIENHKNNPFCLYVSTFEPHSPYNGPYNDLYDPASLPVGPAFLKKPENAPLISRLRAENNMQFLEGSSGSYKGYVEKQIRGVHNDISSEHGWRELRAKYLANITLVDDMVGMIVKSLEEQGVLDDTVIVFTSEHGEMAGDHGMLEKRSMYEESARVPLIIRAPKISTDKKVVSGNFSHVDLVPTLLDLLGVDLPSGLDGKSVSEVLEDGTNLRNNEVFVEWNGIGSIEDRLLGTPDINSMHQAPWRTIVYRDWKLNLCATDKCELFNLREDPHELNNLIDDPANQDVVRLLSTKIRAWQYKTNDKAPL